MRKGPLKFLRLFALAVYLWHGLVFASLVVLIVAGRMPVANLVGLLDVTMTLLMTGATFYYTSKELDLWPYKKGGKRG